MKKTLCFYFQILSRENIQAMLEKHCVEERTIEKFTTALDECEFERYAPGDPAGNMNRFLPNGQRPRRDIAQKQHPRYETAPKLTKGHNCPRR